MFHSFSVANRHSVIERNTSINSTTVYSICKRIGHEFVNGHCDISVVPTYITLDISQTVWLIIGSVHHCAECFVYLPTRMNKWHNTITMRKTKRLAFLCHFITLVWRHSHSRHIKVLVLKRYSKDRPGPGPAQYEICGDRQQVRPASLRTVTPLQSGCWVFITVSCHWMPRKLYVWDVSILFSLNHTCCSPHIRVNQSEVKPLLSIANSVPVGEGA